MSIFDVIADNLVPIAFSLVAVAVAIKFFSAGSSKKPESKTKAAVAAEPLTRFVVGRVGDLQAGQMKEVKLEREAGSILLLREGDTYLATGSKCTHAQAPLAKGVFLNGRIKCPWHGACFDAKSGDIEEMPGLDSLQSFPVTVEADGTISIAASAKALKENWKRTPHVCARNESRDARVFAIVGAGAAGISCAENLRKEGFEGRIVLIGQEPHLPYDRTKLSKTMSLAVDKMHFRAPAFFAEANIETILGVEAREIDAAQKTVSLSDGAVVKYDRLFVATGATPRLLNCPGSNLPGIHCLRVPEEAAKILSLATKETRLVIVGSSFIGMETAAVLFDKVASVDVIGMEKTPFERVLGAEVGAALQRFHEEKGKIRFHLTRVVSEFQGENGKLTGVLLDNGTLLPASLVVMGAGVVPATSFFKAGVQKERDNSIVVDEYLRAADGLFCGGDIARYPFHRTANSLVRIEHIGMAMYHGKIAALNMLDRNVKCVSIPFFWTQAYGKSLRYCGHALKYDNILIDGSLEKLEFVAYYTLEGVVLAAASIGRDPVVAVVAELMAADLMPSLKQLLAEQASGKITLGGRI